MECPEILIAREKQEEKKKETPKEELVLKPEPLQVYFVFLLIIGKLNNL